MLLIFLYITQVTFSFEHKNTPLDNIIQSGKTMQLNFKILYVDINPIIIFHQFHKVQTTEHIVNR